MSSEFTDKCVLKSVCALLFSVRSICEYGPDRYAVSVSIEYRKSKSEIVSTKIRTFPIITSRAQATATHSYTPLSSILSFETYERRRVRLVFTFFQWETPTIPIFLFAYHLSLPFIEKRGLKTYFTRFFEQTSGQDISYRIAINFVSMYRFPQFFTNG